MIQFQGRKATWYRWLLQFKNVKDSTHLLISKGSKIVNGTTIGDGTCINGKIIIKGKGSCIIGKYCAFGDGIRIITSNHNTTDIVLQYSLRKRLGMEVQVDEKKDVEIGSNVWIGDQVLILPGISIGNSAIIAAGSVITKDVPAYAIAGGVPAKIIKYRFSEERIEELKKLEWWDWPLDKLKREVHLLQS